MANDDAFLAAYDERAFPATAVAVDVALLTIENGALVVGVSRRASQPQRGRAALIGTFVGPTETLDAAAVRALEMKAALSLPVRQFGAFGRPDRDPRMRIVSIGFAALMPTPIAGAGLEFLPLVSDIPRGAGGRAVKLALDHGEILAAAIDALRFDLDHSLWAFGLLPAEFTLRELQIVHEAIRGRSLNKTAFRKRLVDSGKLVGTGRLQTGGKYRPAELYTVNRDWEAGDA